jgi:hypothetical protein
MVHVEVSVFCSWVFKVDGKALSGSYRYAVRCFGQKPMETQWWPAPHIWVKGASDCPSFDFKTHRPSFCSSIALISLILKASSDVSRVWWFWCPGRVLEGCVPLSRGDFLLTDSARLDRI